MEQNIEQKPTTFVPAPVPTKKVIGVEQIREAYQINTNRVKKILKTG